MAVITRPEALKPDEIGEFLVNKFVFLLFRTLAVWAFLAVFFPTVGATYILVLCAAIALHFALPSKSQAMVHTIRRRNDAKARKEQELERLRKLAGKA